MKTKSSIKIKEFSTVSILTLFLGLNFLSLNSYAAKPKNEKEIKMVYKDFEIARAELFKTDFNRKNFKEKFNQIFVRLNSSLTQVQKLEDGPADSIVLTSEGNQMAFDIEILEPLQILAKGNASKEDCNEARQIHELNFPVVKDENSKAIDNILNKVCL